jgi:ABC-type multidrug transport system ATPase subunit
MHALQTLIVGRTVLTISHRLSTLGQVDEIIVLQKGRIAEHGTYEQLKAAGGLFAHLLAEQNRYNLEHRAEQTEQGSRVVRRPASVVASRAPAASGRRPRSRRATRVGVAAGGPGRNGHGPSPAAEGPDLTVQRGCADPNDLASAVANRT